jgi:hypothetical protein
MAMTQLINLKGKKFDDLTVIELADQDKYKRYRWKCICVCGAEVVVGSNNLRTGNTKSCGCRKEKWLASGNAWRSHGMSATREYKSWLKMLERCRDPNNNRYKYYGGRGIKVYKLWLKFEKFYADMGQRPIGKTLDRIDVNADYKPGNCRWATPLEQRHNRRR